MGWWRRSKDVPRWSPPDPIPDHDTVVPPGHRRWSDLLDADGLDEAARRALNEPTQLLPTDGPLLTRGGWWRGTRGGRQ